jgi:hypothetical protein
MTDDEKLAEIYALVTRADALLGEVHGQMQEVYALLMKHQDLLAFASNLKQKATSPFGKIARVK